MPIRDRNIAWKRQRHVIPATAFNMVVAGATNLTGIGVGIPTFAELSTYGISGIATATADDFATVDFLTPSLMDVSKEIGVRVLYTINETPVATDGVTYIVTYDQVDDNEAFAASPAGVLDTILVEDLDGGTTPFVLRRSSRGIINANKFDDTARYGALVWTVEHDASTDTTNDAALFLGLQIDYMPNLTHDAQQDRDAIADLSASAGV